MKNTHRRPALYELFSSMRFAIGLLVLLAIASVIGTVLPQNQAYADYVITFGSFWFQIFATLGLYDVYHTGWFIGILAFLVLSISLCIIRNSPGFVRSWRSFRISTTLQGLTRLRYSMPLTGRPDLAAALNYLQQQGFRYRQKALPDGQLLIAAKKGSISRLGYFLAHLAMIIIFLGGLIDSNLPLALARWSGKVVPETRDLPQSQVPAYSRLSADNLAFRGDVTLAEQKSSDVIFLNAGPGYLVQELPFFITLRRFTVDYYRNGMPRHFASDIRLTDKATGRVREAQVVVNHPVQVDGIAIYQAGFSDGGSPLKLKLWNLADPAQAPRQLNSQSGQALPLNCNGQSCRLEIGELRVVNAVDKSSSPDSQRWQDFRSVKHEADMQNLGPSIRYTLRNAKGLAQEYVTYLAPITIDGGHYWVRAMRRDPVQPFESLRIPLDQQQSITSFMRLLVILHKDTARIATMTATRLTPATNQAADRAALARSLTTLLRQLVQSGLPGVDKLIKPTLPPAQRAQWRETSGRLLEASLVDAMQLAKADISPASKPRFVLDSLLAIDSLSREDSPVLLQLDDFTPIPASVLQMTRAPGKPWVWFGTLLLVAGIFLMLFVQEQRLWLLLQQNDARLAMILNRPGHQLSAVFQRHLQGINSLPRSPHDHDANT